MSPTTSSQHDTSQELRLVIAVEAQRNTVQRRAVLAVQLIFHKQIFPGTFATPLLQALVLSALSYAVAEEPL